jgi:epsilon-lactone hydrolase
MPDSSFAASLPPPPETLSPEARAHLAAMAAAGVTQTVDVPQMRQFTEQIQALVGAEQRKAHDVSVADDVIAGVPVRRIARGSGEVDRRRILLNLHGGGFATDSGSLTENIPIAALSGIEVVAVLYRFAPEHPFPAAVDDAAQAYRWLLARHPHTKVVLAGDSAGAGLAVATAIGVRDSGQRQPAAIVGFSPYADLAVTGESVESNAKSCAMFTPQGVREAAGMYLHGADPRDPRASPLYGDLRGLPPMLLFASQHEILRDDTLRLAERARGAGVDVHLVVRDRLPHVWPVFVTLLPEARDAFGTVTSFARTVTAS